MRRIERIRRDQRRLREGREAAAPLGMRVDYLLADGRVRHAAELKHPLADERYLGPLVTVHRPRRVRGIVGHRAWGRA